MNQNGNLTGKHRAEGDISKKPEMRKGQLLSAEYWWFIPCQGKTRMYPTANRSAELMIFSTRQSYECRFPESFFKGFSHVSLQDQGWSNISYSVRNMPLGAPSFPNFCMKAIVGRAVWLCLSLCQSCWHRTWKPASPLALGWCWPQAASLAGMQGATQAWPAGNLWHRCCGELHVTKQQEGGREPCRSEMPWHGKAAEEEGGMLLVPRLE